MESLTDRQVLSEGCALSPIATPPSLTRSLSLCRRGGGSGSASAVACKLVGCDGCWDGEWRVAGDGNWQLAARRTETGSCGCTVQYGLCMVANARVWVMESGEWKVVRPPFSRPPNSLTIESAADLRSASLISPISMFRAFSAAQSSAADRSDLNAVWGSGTASPPFTSSTASAAVATSASIPSAPAAWTTDGGSVRPGCVGLAHSCALDGGGGLVGRSGGGASENMCYEAGMKIGHTNL